MLGTGKDTWFPLADIGIAADRKTAQGDTASRELNNIIALLRNPDVLGSAEAEVLEAPSVFSRLGLQTVAKTLHEVLDKRVSRDASGDDLLDTTHPCLRWARAAGI